ncbi:MAG: GNAT family N-acetyltransferase [Pseudomonadota bacterium]|nr:GNAT family N-acetyltransferase [Pseudomonadota bacterium]
MNGVQWQWKTFVTLSVPELYAVVALREAVFIVEQRCPYQDADGLDADADHLLGWGEDGRLMAYLRVLAPGVRFEQPSIGRVIVHESARRSGLGRQLMQQGLQRCAQRWPNQDVALGAQAHLESFYGSLGFERCSAPYDEDGIPHIDMQRAARPAGAA